MVGTPDILAGQPLAFGLTTLGTTVARPSFELSFNILQNTIIDRLNKEIEAAKESSSETIDAFLTLSQKKLRAFQENVDRFTVANGHNAWALAELSNNLEELDAALQANDTPAFNAKLRQINDTVGRLTPHDGSAIGIFLDDGTTAMRRDGLVNVTRDGAKVKVTDYSQFLDAAEAQTAVDNAQTKIATALNAVLARAEAAAKLGQVTDRNLLAVDTEIEATKTARDAELAAQLAKLREKYAILLNDLSLAFESNQALAEQLGKGLFDPNKVDPGSIVNVFS